MPSSRFAALDLLRGIAALAVVLFHAEAIFHLKLSGYLCVDLFFVLSGFVLGYSYEHRLHGGMTATVFLRSRLIRLYPLYLVGTLIGLVVLPQYNLPVTLAFALAFLPAPIPGPLYPLYPLDPPAWSLLCELWINAIWAIVKPKRIGAIVTVAGLILVGVALSYDSLTVGPKWETADGGFARVAFSFFMGLAVWRCFARKERTPLPAWVAVAAAGAFILIISIEIPAPWKLAFDLPATMVGFPIIIYLAARTRLSGKLCTIATQAGLASYPLYVIHWPVLHLYDSFAAPTSSLWWTAIPALIVLSLALERFVHEPVKSFLTSRALHTIEVRP